MLKLWYLSSCEIGETLSISQTWWLISPHRILFSGYNWYIWLIHNSCSLCKVGINSRRVMFHIKPEQQRITQVQVAYNLPLHGILWHAKYLLWITAVICKINLISCFTCSSISSLFTFTFMHLADAFIQSDLQLHSGYTFSLVHVFPGNRTHNLLRNWRNALPLSHTGTLFTLFTVWHIIFVH